MPPTSTAVSTRTCSLCSGRSWYQSATATLKLNGYNALGYREVLGISVDDSEAKRFCPQLLHSIKELCLIDNRLLIPDGPYCLGGSVQANVPRQHLPPYREVYFLRNPLSHFPQASQDLFAEAI